LPAKPKIYQGEGAPSDIHPLDLRKADVSRTNTSQFLPYMSKDFELHSELYKKLSAAFEDVFTWIEDVVSKGCVLQFI